MKPIRLPARLLLALLALAGLSVICLSACGTLGEDGKPAAGSARADGRRAPRTRVLLIGHRPDHPHGTHMYLHECRLLATCLEQTIGVEAVVADGWPKEKRLLDDVDAIVLYSSAGGDLLLGGPHRKEFESLLARGVGYTAIHWATADNKVARGPEYLEVLGGWFNFAHCGLNVTRGTLIQSQSQSQSQPEHPICRGWKPYDLHEEYYLNMKFHPKSTPVIEVEIDGKRQVVAWVLERRGGGRSFGTTLGHFHENFTIEAFRRAIVNGILWTARLEVPEGGAPCAIGEKARRLDPPVAASPGK